MKFLNKKTIFVTLFAMLYLCVGLVSTIHAISFFGLANSPVLGTILAITFEIGQAAVLFNLLTNTSQRKRIMPWALMSILTLVQIMGNIFSSYKYLITNSTENLRYFKEPIFIWTDLPDAQCNVIITYIVGAILPIVALCLTEMVVSYLGTNNDEIPKVDITNTEVDENMVDKNIVDENIVDENIVNDTGLEVMIDPPTTTSTTTTTTSTTTTTTSTISPESIKEVDEMLSGPVKQDIIDSTKPASRFINL